MSDQATPKAQAEKLMEGMLKGKEVHEFFTDRMKARLLISGQTMDSWEEKFKLSIPTDNLTPTLCKQISMDLLGLHQEATFHYAVATAKAQMIKRGAEASYNGKFNKLVQEYTAAKKRLPAADTLKAMASIDNEELDSAQSIADIEVRFWKSILEHLHVCRKLIEGASMNIAVELKATHNDAAIDRLASVNNGG